jgi:hypothetical protein
VISLILDRAQALNILDKNFIAELYPHPMTGSVIRRDEET